MFKRSITSDLYAPKNIADQVDSGSSGLQKEWWPVIFHNCQKYQLPLTGGAFAVVLFSAFALDYLQAIAIQDLSSAIQSQQRQIQVLQVEVKSREIKQTELMNTNTLTGDDELVAPVITYWGLMRASTTTKALIEVNQEQRLLKVGQAVGDGWFIKYFDQEHLQLESKQGQVIKISMESPS